MDYFFDTNQLPSFLVPFVSLSYRVDPPPNPDSFPNSSYYDIGYLDVCLIVTIIAIMAILRDAARGLAGQAQCQRGAGPCAVPDA